MRNGSLKTKRQYYTYKEILEIVDKLKNSEIVNFDADGLSSSVTNLINLGTNTIELAKNFYKTYFDQEFGILQNRGKNNFKLIDIFDLPIKEGDKSSIELKQLYVNNNYCQTSFSSITLIPDSNIHQTEEYIHEVGHALLERNNKVDDPMLSELIPILLELIFAYDIDTDLKNYIKKDSVYLNKYNMSSVAYIQNDGDIEYNYATLRYLIQDRVVQLISLKEIYKNEQKEENKENYSKYLKSIEEALLIFETFVNGNILVISEIDDVLKGNITVSEFVKKCKEDYKNYLNNSFEESNKIK